MNNVLIPVCCCGEYVCWSDRHNMDIRIILLTLYLNSIIKWSRGTMSFLATNLGSKGPPILTDIWNKCLCTFKTFGNVPWYFVPISCSYWKGVPNPQIPESRNQGDAKSQSLGQHQPPVEWWKRQGNLDWMLVHVFVLEVQQTISSKDCAM